MQGEEEDKEEGERKDEDLHDEAGQPRQLPEHPVPEKTFPDIERTIWVGEQVVPLSRYLLADPAGTGSPTSTDHANEEEEKEDKHPRGGELLPPQVGQAREEHGELSQQAGSGLRQRQHAELRLREYNGVRLPLSSANASSPRRESRAVQPLDHRFEGVGEAAVDHWHGAEWALLVALKPQLYAGTAAAVPTRGDGHGVAHDIQADGTGY